MISINDFMLEQHTGPYEQWPLRSRLYYKGNASDCYVPGYLLEAQYAFSEGYILIISYDCPFEERNEILFLDRLFKIKAKKSIHGELLYTHWPCSENQLALHFYSDHFYQLSISYKKFLLFKWPYIGLIPYVASADMRSQQSSNQLREVLHKITVALDNDKK